MDETFPTFAAVAHRAGQLGVSLHERWRGLRSPWRLAHRLVGVGVASAVLLILVAGGVSVSTIASHNDSLAAFATSTSLPPWPDGITAERQDVKVGRLAGDQLCGYIVEYAVRTPVPRVDLALALWGREVPGTTGDSIPPLVWVDADMRGGTVIYDDTGYRPHLDPRCY